MQSVFLKYHKWDAIRALPIKSHGLPADHPAGYISATSHRTPPNCEEQPVHTYGAGLSPLTGAGKRMPGLPRAAGPCFASRTHNAIRTSTTNERVVRRNDRN